MTAEQARLTRRGERLYERYAKPHETAHAGKFIAISPKGQTIIGDTMLEVAKQAAAEFGRGNFIFKLGPRSVGKWR